MMKARGGRRYRGGTAADNPAMLRRFRARGGEEVERMEAWGLGHSAGWWSRQTELMQ